MNNEIRKCRVLIADDHSIILSGIKLLLSYQLKINNVFECTHLDELIHKIQETHPTHLLLDVSFPEGSGISILNTIYSEFPDLKVCIFTMHPKSMFENVLRKYPKLYFCEKRSTEAVILEYFKHFLSNQPINDAENGSNTISKSKKLSKREEEIMMLLIDGSSTQDIAKKLGIKSNTVSTIKNRIFDKLQVNNVLELSQIYK